MMEILFAWFLGFLGTFLFALQSVWAQVKNDRKFDVAKSWRENKIFWILTIVLNLVITVVLKFVPEAADLVNLAVNLETNVGYFLIGWVLAGGTNNLPQTGKKLQNKNGNT
jgi:hypothetical protein